MPALEIWEILEFLIIVGVSVDPTNTGHISDRIFACNIIMADELPIKHPIKSIDLMRITVNSVLDFFTRINAEMASLPGHWAKAAHLPHEPFIYCNPLSLILRVEFPEFPAQILEDRTGFKNGNRIATRSFRIDNCGHSVVGGDFQKLGIKLIAFADIDIFYHVGNAKLF